MSSHSAKTKDYILKLDQACSAAEEFQKLFYESFDKRRTVLDKLYMETATMVWNGNLVEGSKEIVKFLETLPVSEHTIDLLDCHPILGYDKMCRAEVLIHLRFLLYTFLISFLPILDLVFKTFQFTAFETIPYLYICPLDSVTNGQTSIMVVAGGKVRFQGNKTFPFNENFVLTSQQGKWKIASNTFRYFE
ncbi:putative NTF2-related export protein 2 [Apostichopus japonicus]|uniref:Putative NTF2-related export protein 2 n=1 Tax=Stichopus japonicus TaxID=307972 RepID=A0A2G8L216_STIJA|nr:putative NTF2-related export protein 2 [Apostichopus japonicus]